MIKKIKLMLSAFSLIAMLSAGCAPKPVTQKKELVDGVEFQKSTSMPAPTATKITPKLRAEIKKSIDRGLTFLVATQNKDGSFGGPGNSKGLNILTPVPSGHDNYREACTALCISAMIEANSDSPAVINALDKATKWLLKSASNIKRSSPEVVYNLWSHSYTIEAFVRLYNRLPADSPKRKEFFNAIKKQVQLLSLYQTETGGWAYYAFDPRTREMRSSPVSFATATCLIALKKADSIGVKISPRTVRRALDVVYRLRNPNFTYAYDDRFLLFRGGGTTNIPASLGRAQVCNLSTKLWGDKRITDKLVLKWADYLIEKNSWISRGRKTPVPHESWFNVAGYYYYYGHYYAFENLALLPKVETEKYRARLAIILMKHQEKDDGSWWDFPVFNYGKYFGTPFAIMSLAHCL